MIGNKPFQACQKESHYKHDSPVLKRVLGTYNDGDANFVSNGYENP